MVYIEFDISSILDTAIINGVSLSFNGTTGGQDTMSVDVKSLASQPSVSAGSTIWSDYTGGTLYFDDQVKSGPGMTSYTLGFAGDSLSDFNSTLTSGTDWFAVGLGDGSNATVYLSEIIAPSLYVDYTPVATPDSPVLNTSTISATTMAWTWSDPNSGAKQEDTIELHDASHAVVETLTVDYTSTQETDLSTNTAYTRHIYVSNVAGSAESNSITKYTYASKPDAPDGEQSSYLNA